MLLIQPVIFCTSPTISNWIANVITLNIVTTNEAACDRNPICTWTNITSKSIINIRDAHTLCQCDQVAALETLFLSDLPVRSFLHRWPLGNTPELKPTKQTPFLHCSHHSRLSLRGKNRSKETSIISPASVSCGLRLGWEISVHFPNLDWRKVAQTAGTHVVPPTTDNGGQKGSNSLVSFLLST